MEPQEFLGGKYQELELIVPGEVQTFRARETATGRVVFAHRVSTSGGEAQQAALLRLLLQGIFRSPSAKSQVLDFGEEPGFCYVVTESLPQCLLLREWLQFELDSAKQERGAQASKPAESAAADTEPKPPAVSPSESRDMKASPDNKVTVERKVGPVPFVIREQPVRPAAGTASPSRPEVLRKDSTPAIPPKIEPVRELEPEPVKLQAKPEPVPAPPNVDPIKEPKPEPAKPKAEPVSPGPSQSEPGEFTRFFKGGLPPSAPSRPEAFRSQDRPSHGFGPVQRPSNPPSLPPKNEPGEFTRVFMKSGGQPATPAAPPKMPVQPPSNLSSTGTGFPDSGDFATNAFGNPRVERLPDLANRPSDLPNMFQSNAEAPTPMRSAAQEPGEYTRMFGKGGIPPPPLAPSAVGPSPSFRTDDPLGGTNIGMPAVVPGPQAPPQPSGPSEFTLVMMGNRPQEPGGGQGAPPTGAPAGGGAPGGMPAPPAMGKPPAFPGQIPGMGGQAAPAGGPQAPMGSMAPAPPMGAPMGGAMGPLHVTPMNPMYAAGGPGMGMGQGVSTNLGGMGSAGASMGNPLMGQAGHMGVMTPLGQAHVGGGSMQPMGHGGAPAGHPAAGGPAAGGHPAMPGGFSPGAVPKAPATGLGSKGKLLILFAVLGVLAVAMVLFVIFAGHK